MGKLPKIASSPPCTGENDFAIACPGDLQDECTIEMQMVQLGEKWRPVNFAVSRRKVVILSAVIVARVNHPEMSGKFTSHCREVFSKMGVSRIQTNTHLR